MRIYLPLVSDTDNSTPGEVGFQSLDRPHEKHVKIILERPYREVVISRDQLRKVLRYVVED